MPPKPSPTVAPAVLVALIICGTVLGLAAIAGFVVLVLNAPPETDLVKLLGAVGTGLALVIAQVANYVKTGRVESRVAAQGAQVEYLTNGGTDAKVRAGLADIIDPRFLKPDVGEQLEADRAHRAASPAARAGAPHA